MTQPAQAFKRPVNAFELQCQRHRRLAEVRCELDVNGPDSETQAGGKPWRAQASNTKPAPDDTAILAESAELPSAG